ncbi:MAG: efflux RND transporter periplasmic adaptor subunit [Bacteroidia bacterium]|nr:efflux RND transporter periplasmic adaptor subunit [Bacteroidia bacterium]
MKKFSSFFYIHLLFYSCSHPIKNEQSEQSAYLDVNGDTVTINAHVITLNKIQISQVQESNFSKKLTCAGIVKTIPNKFAKVSTPFPGRVIKAFVKLGDKVKEGDPLFAISSSDFFDTQKNYFDAKEEYKKAELNLKRQQDLIKNNVGVQKELEEAETEFATKKTALENAAAALKLFNIQPEQITLGEPLIIRSPIAGEIIDNKIVIGEYLKEDADPIISVAELSKVWIAGKIKEKDIDVLNNLSQVEIYVSAFPDKKIKGKLFYIGKTVDEESRSIDVLIETDNSEEIFKPGMYVTVQFFTHAQKKIVIPSEAILQANDYSYVFVKINDHQFLRNKIIIESRTKDSSVVGNGLQPNQFIITKGAIYLLQPNQ